jgi:hypothetical protein
MQVRTLIGLGVALAVAALAGCGGGGAAVPSTTVISGMASKGPISGGTVKIYAVRSGAEDRTAPIGQGTTDAGGNYSVDVGSYQGPVLVEVSGGSFLDEVSGAPITLKSAAQLRAIISSATTGNKTVAVTPLTELAYKKAKGAAAVFTAAAIDDANASIALSFKLADIVSTLPIAGGANDDQKKYAAVCGSFSQYVNDNRTTGESLDDALPRLLNQMGDELEHGGGFSIDTLTKMGDAITKFSGSDKNRSGTTITPPPAPTHGLLKLSTAGTASTIGAIDVMINLPAGVTVAADPAKGETAAGVVELTGAAKSGDNILAAAKFTPSAGGTPGQLHIALVTTSGFGPGEFATIKFDLAAGTGFPASASAFTVASFSANGIDGSPLGGETAAPASVGVVMN